MGPVTGYGYYNGGYGGRGTGSSGPRGTAARSAAARVKDYGTAKTYLGDKIDRPLRYATRLQRVTRVQGNGELVGACEGYAVTHHGTPIVVWRRDGLTEFYAYNSVTTKQRLGQYLPFSVSSDRGRLAVWHDYASLPRTPRRILKCRTCQGVGTRGSQWCGAWRYGSDRAYPCGRPRYSPAGAVRLKAHRGHYYGADRVPCDDCRGLGTRDYGSRPIPFHLEHAEWYLVAGDRIAGHLGGTSSRWSKVSLPARPPKPRKIPHETVTGEIVAYRGWRMDDTGRLTPLGIDGPPYESFNLPAARHVGDIGHTAPAPGCACGYWAMKDPNRIPSYGSNNALVVRGAVRLWGTVLEHEIGYRAERMTVDYLVVGSERTAAALVTRYPDVPVYVTSWPVLDLQYQLSVGVIEPYRLHEGSDA